MRHLALILLVIPMLAACTNAGEPASTTSTTAAPPPTVNADTLQLYRSEEHGFSIRYPDGWEVETEPELVSFAAPAPESGFTDNFNVAVGEVSEEVPRAAYYEGEIGRLRSQLREVEVLESADVTIDDGIVGRGITVTAQLADGTRVGIVRLLVLHEGRAWEVSFFTPQERLNEMAPLISAVLQSFQPSA